MIEDPQSLVAASRMSAPSPATPSSGEQALSPPTAEQTRAVDDVFTAPAQPHPVATVLGVWTGVLMLHDVFVDTFAKSAEVKREEQDTKEDEDGDAAD